MIIHLLNPYVPNASENASMNLFWQPRILLNGIFGFVRIKRSHNCNFFVKSQRLENVYLGGHNCLLPWIGHRLITQELACGLNQARLRHLNDLSC